MKDETVTIHSLASLTEVLSQKNFRQLENQRSEHAHLTRLSLIRNFNSVFKCPEFYQTSNRGIKNSDIWIQMEGWRKIVESKSEKGWHEKENVSRSLPFPQVSTQSGMCSWHQALQIQINGLVSNWKQSTVINQDFGRGNIIHKVLHSILERSEVRNETRQDLNRHLFCDEQDEFLYFTSNNSKWDESRDV